MSIYQKVRAVERVFALLEKDIEKFKSHSGLNCVNGCGECCKKNDIEATILEFLPYAYFEYKNGNVFEVLEKVATYSSENSICFLFSPFSTSFPSGSCREYKYRGLICRLFGFSAFINKMGEPQLSTCKKIKEAMPANVRIAEEYISSSKKVPVMRNYYFTLMAIDRDLAEKRYPVNIALKKALETVCAYYSYRGKRIS